tara:strand:- start:973 stop:1377 length:405 start_codon:yes stop_codon:yes gene_type:complete
MDCSKNLIIKKNREEQIIQLVQRQTDYDRETTIKKIAKWDNNYLYVIKEYMNPDFNPNKKKEKKNNSKNQMVFSEIRSFMDTANKQYLQRKKQEKFQKERQQQLYMQYLKQKKEHEKQKAKKKMETITENKIIE